jgi:hypothetical protein
MYDWSEGAEMMHTELYCQNLAALEPVAAIRAIHQGYLQLAATADIAADESYDNKPSMAALASILRACGHPGFN